MQIIINNLWSIKNPFENPEPRQTLFESLPSYQKLKKNSLKKFWEQEKNVSKSQFSINTVYMSLKNTFKKFTVATISISALLILAISAVAAEAVAPQKYKPSVIVENLFWANQQKKPTPTPL